MDDKILESYIANPSTNMVDVISNSGYTLNSAIADIIDNSISANAKNIDIRFIFNGLDSKIVIIDDGDGMNYSKIKEALIYANRNVNDVRASNDIGRYSIGLNSASSSFCNCLFLTSKVENQEQNSVVMDFDHIRDSKKWEIFRCKNRDDYLIKNHGTIVLWERLQLEKDKSNNVNILLNYELITPLLKDLELHLSRVFYRYIKFHGVVISLNNNVIEGWDPFLTFNSDTQVCFKDIYEVNGSKIRIEGYVLPVAEHLSPFDKDYEFGFGKGLSELQGFYVYREDRLISYGGWLNIDGLPRTDKANYARIGLFVDNKLDSYLSVNFIKNQIILPADLSAKLKPIAKDIRLKSSNNYDYKKNPRPYIKNKDIIEKPWITTKTRNGIKAQINVNHPVIKDACKNMSLRDKKILFDLLSKTIPIADFESYHGVDDAYTKDEMINLLSITFDNQIKKNKSKEEIFQMFKTTLPYCDKKYADILYDFIEEMKNE